MQGSYMKKEIKVLISACLLGDNVKYSGGNNLTPELVTLLEKYNVVTVLFLYSICKKNSL